MSGVLSSYFVLRSNRADPIGFIRDVLGHFDQGGLRYHFFERGTSQFLPGLDQQGSTVVQEESTINLGSSHRVQRSTELLLEHVDLREDRFELAMDLDCRGMDRVDGPLADSIGASLRLTRAHAPSEFWILGIQIDDLATLTEADDSPSCWEEFLIAGVLPVFDEGLGVFGCAGSGLRPPSAEFLRSAERGIIPDVFSLNLYPPPMVGRYGLRARKPGSKLWGRGRIIAETDGGSLCWELQGTPEELETLWALSKTERLRALGIPSESVP